MESNHYCCIIYKIWQFFIRSLYLICHSRIILVFGLLFVVWQSYNNFEAQKELYRLARESLEAIRADLITLKNIHEPLYVHVPPSAETCSCASEYNKIGNVSSDYPTIYTITPTFARPLQKAELTRISQTFLLAPNFHWIVVEDSPNKTSLVTNFLAQSGLNYTHLYAPTPSKHKPGKNEPKWKHPRGVEQRNVALRWIRANLNERHNGVIYFADDDNTYSRHLFQEIRKVKRVGIWPVGLVGGLMVEGPICDKVTKKVTGFKTAWATNRPFPIDMAGFAINLQVILEKKNAEFSYKTLNGLHENHILRQVTTREELEGLANGCTKVYVWHTQTSTPDLHAEKKLEKQGKSTNSVIEV
ncbi:galactosylgalactosylxylosylprotein 3-beta-glucuronosyltransferase I [Copidosoma floridanum]|uniref:galactosylgalactosylxylosylprotein 3-beta-glucuronosyltransferase I n=1 Tax=Copidosoma floridanum TaxID=29053 RepID=UPI0006C9AF61|nr:galactosylgalactosylxylosylprotein 3-beta-glucuronosyltransferase I [Copidosoma floridanum]